MKKVFCVVLVYVFLEVTINSLLGCSRRHANVNFNSYCTVTKQIIAFDATSSRSKVVESEALESIEKESNTNIYRKFLRGKAGSLSQFEKPDILPDFSPKEVLGETSSLFIHMFEFSRPNVFIMPEVSPVILVEDDEDFTDELSSYGSYDDNVTSHESGEDTTVDFDLEEALDFDEEGDGNETSSDETWHMDMEDYSEGTSDTESREDETEISGTDDSSASCCDCCRDSSVNDVGEKEYKSDSEKGGHSETEETESADSENEHDMEIEYTNSENKKSGSENKNARYRRENTDSENENTDGEKESTDSEHETDSGDEIESDENNSENEEVDTDSSANTKNHYRAAASEHDSGSSAYQIEIDTSAPNTVLEGSSDEEQNLQDILITADCAHVDMKHYIDENQLEPLMESKHQHVWSNRQFEVLQSRFIRDTIRTPGRKLLVSLMLLSRIGNIPNTHVGRLF